MLFSKLVASDKVSIKREVELDEEEGSSKFLKGSNEAGMSDVRPATFNQCT